MTRYVITGASGHIGNNLVRYINRLQPEVHITVLTRRLVGIELAGTRCEQVMGDLCDESYLCQNITPGSVVIHLAGLIDLTDARWEETYKVNVEVSNLLCDVCRRQKVARYIYVGSVDAIPRTSQDAVITEPIIYNPDRVEGHYGRSKAMAIQHVLDSITTYPNFKAAVVLPSAVIGPHDYKPSAVGAIIRDTLAGKPEFGIAGGYNFVFVEDVCSAIVTLCRSQHRGQYILSGDNVTVEELYDGINRLMHVCRKPIMIPLPIVRLCLPFVPKLNKIMLKALREPHDYVCDKARMDLNYKPTPFYKTLYHTVAWFRKHDEFSAELD